MSFKRFASFAAALAVGLSLSFALSSCGAAKKSLHVYNWGDYIDPSIVKDFEKEFNCKVKMDFFDSNESMYAKVKAGGGGYDVIVPSSYQAEVMFKQKMIRSLDKAKLPNLKNVDPDYLAKAVDSKMDYCVPYLISFTGIGYNKDKVKGFKPSWRMFEDSSVKGRCVLLNDPREGLGAALRTLGFSLNTVKQDELDKAVKLLESWKKNIAKFDVDEAKRGLASGEFWMIQSYNGDILQATEENKSLEFVIPEEGSSFSADTLVVPCDAPDPELALAFIDFLLRPDVAAKNMQFLKYLAPNLEAMKLLPAEFRSNPVVFPPPAVWAKCEVIRDLGDDNAKYSKAWDAVKAAESH